MEIKIADNIPGAEYTNIMQVNHTPEEFTMIFANVAGASGKFGAIKTAMAPEAEKGMGFGERK